MQHVFFEINEDGSEAVASTGRTNGFMSSREKRLGGEFVALGHWRFCGTQISPPAV